MDAPLTSSMAKIGRYRPILPLGQGGMAEVLLAVGRGPRGFSKLVVLKSMRSELSEDPELREMFLAEARLSAQLNHANVVQVYEVLDQQCTCIVMEYLDGQAMSEVYKAGRESFRTDIQLRVISEVLAGLHYSHQLCDYDGSPLNLVHRDVSPQNVFITYDGQVKVLDFGIAKVASAPGHTRTGIVKGKIAYMPPEQLLGGLVDRRADIYAVGCMLWQAAAGKKLWAGKRDGEIIRALVDGAIPPPSTERPVEPRLEAMVMKALSPAADARFATALELQNVLDEFLAERSTMHGTRDIGAYVAQLFDEQRRARAKVIHAAISAPESTFPPPDESSAAKRVSLPLQGVESSASGVVSLHTRTRRRLPVLVGASALVLVLGATGAYSAWRVLGPGQHTPSASTEAQWMSLSISVQPRDARVTLDGAPVGGNPTTIRHQVDGAEHELRAEREGYFPLQSRLRFERDLSVETVLRPKPTAAPVASSQPPPEPSRPSANNRSIAHARVGIRPVRGGIAAPSSNRIEDQPSHATTLSCDPPFYMENGIKVYKPGCL